MSYEVLVDSLRAGAGDYESIAASLGVEGPDLASVEPGTFGHVELAAWVRAVTEQCDHAARALHDGAAGLADSLAAAAHYYESTDDSVGAAFRTPIDLLGGSR